MANSWLRLWHDMPNDPKWRTIARVSGESVSLVTATYMHMLVDASRNVTRGHVTVTAEDLASALDVTEQQITSIFNAMEGRVLENGHLSGWEKRQPKREDSGDDETGVKSAAQRKQEQREREKQALIDAAKSDDKTQCHDASRNVTLDKDKDKDKEVIPSLSESTIPTCPHDELIDLFVKQLPSLPMPNKGLWKKGKNAPALKARWAWLLTATHESGSRKGERMAATRQEGLDWFSRFFGYVGKSAFLMGQSSDWACDLIWLVNAANFEKVLQGTYENKAVAA